MELPLKDLIVLDFSQFLAAPSAALRLADLGATVIKIERPKIGDLSRQLYISNLNVDGDSTLFHTINRNKRSFAADLKNPEDLEIVKRLIVKADVMIENFRPGVMKRIGLDYESVKKINSRIVYGTITGYGNQGPWHTLPGQDLLVQARSGLVWLNGDHDQEPVPVGLAIVDILAGSHLVQGILATLIRCGKTNSGGLVEVSLLESIIDFQFEVLTTHFNDGGKLPERAKINNAHAYLAAPYGIYKTADGFLAVAMGSLADLANAIECPSIKNYLNDNLAFSKRDEVKKILAEHLFNNTNDYWLSKLQAIDYWCAPVLDWHELTEHEAFKILNMTQKVKNTNGTEIKTTCCPIKIDGNRPTSPISAPKVGEHNDWVLNKILGN